MCAERTCGRQLQALFTAMRLSILNTHYVFNSCSFIYKSDSSTPQNDRANFRLLSIFSADFIQNIRSPMNDLSKS